MRRIKKRPWLSHPFQDWLNGRDFARLDAAYRVLGQFRLGRRGAVRP